MMAAMTWTTTGDAAAFDAAAGGFLRSRPVPNTVLLTVAGKVLRAGGWSGGEPAAFGWWTDGGAIRGAYVHTPPHPVLLSAAPDPAVRDLATRLAAAPPPAVNLPLSGAGAFVDGWRSAAGTDPVVHRRMRLYRLAELREPAVPGSARTVDAGDRELLLRWYEGFLTELGEDVHGLHDVVDDAVGAGLATLWLVDGVPVATAGHSRPEAGMVRIASVYTPAEQRGRGYGAAVTAAASRAAQQAGAGDVVLFTDLDNAATNRLYQRLGYEPVEDRVVLSLRRH